MPKKKTPQNKKDIDKNNKPIKESKTKWAVGTGNGGLFTGKKDKKEGLVYQGVMNGQMLYCRP